MYFSQSTVNAEIRCYSFPWTVEVGPASGRDDDISSVPKSSKSDMESEALCSTSSREPLTAVESFFSFVDDLVILADGGSFGLTNTLSSSSNLAVVFLCGGEGFDRSN